MKIKFKRLIYRLNTHFKHLSIRSKVLIVFFASACILLATSSVALYFTWGHYSEQTLAESDLQSARSFNYAVQGTLNYMMGFSNYIATTSEIQEILLYPEVDFTTPLFDVARQDMEFVSLVLYNAYGQPVEYMSIDTSRDPVFQGGDPERPFYEIIQGYNQYEWEYIKSRSNALMTVDFSPKLTLWRVITNFKTTQPLGAIALSIDSRKLIEAFYSPGLQGISPIALLDNDGTPIFLSSDLMLEMQDSKDLLARIGQSTQGVVNVQLDGVDYAVTYSQIASTDMYTCVFGNHSIFSLGQSTYLFYLAMVALLILLCLLFIYTLMTKYFIHPIALLSESMQQFSSGDFTSKTTFKYKDEIGRLGDIFNNMVQENKELIEQRYILELREKDSELALLQSQMNPHFLYNILSALYWAAIGKDELDLADAIHSMGQFFRLTLSSGNRNVIVEQERDMILHYLTLQKMRLKSRIEYKVEFSADCLNCEIPKLLIEPLVENCVVHGAEKLSRTVNIAVKAWLSADEKFLCVNICDNGSGMSAATLSNLFQNSSSEQLRSQSKSSMGGNRFAVRTIKERLDLMGCGETFRIESQVGIGTEIYLEVPIIDQSNRVENGKS